MPTFISVVGFGQFYLPGITVTFIHSFRMFPRRCMTKLASGQMGIAKTCKLAMTLPDHLEGFISRRIH
jgi:hypothetical protein